jgi:hypothetical protein
MTIDLTGGIEPATDEVTATPPTSPTYREGASIWLWDDEGRFGFPRVGVEAVGTTWETSFGVAFCMALPSGQLLLLSTDGAPHRVADDSGRPRVLGAGPLRFECIEPFAHWRVQFDGDVALMDVHEHLERGKPRVAIDEDTKPVALSLEVDARMAAPPWAQGTYAPEGHFVVGEQRIEQLCTVTGLVQVDGQTTSFTGGGLRIHRKGGNRSHYGDFHGHNWQSARFPSGRAFGFIHYRPRPDGSVKYREGWLLVDGEIVPALVEDTPWLVDTRPTGEDVSFTLRTPNGDVRITGDTFVSMFRPPRPIGDGTTFPLLQSGIAKYQWDGEVAYGMIERSARLSPGSDRL